MATENAIVDLPQSIVDDIVNEKQMIHRLGTMDDIVQAMLYLCSDESSFVTGETLRVTAERPCSSQTVTSRKAVAVDDSLVGMVSPRWNPGTWQRR